MKNGRPAKQPNVGRNEKSRVVPARMNVVAVPAANSVDGILTEGPPTFEPSSRCTVTLSSVRSWTPAVTMKSTDVLNTDPPKHGVSGDNAIGLGEKRPLGAIDDAELIKETPAGGSSHATLTSPSIATATQMKFFT